MRTSLRLLAGLALASLCPLPAAAQAATARFVGIYAAAATSVTVDGIPDEDFEPGGDPLKWRFTPLCPRGACHVRWAELGSGFRGGRVVDRPVASARLARSGNAYRGRYEGCREHYPWALTVTVTKSIIRNGQLVVSRFAATQTKRIPNGDGTFYVRVVKMRGWLASRGQRFSQVLASCPVSSV